MSSNLNLITDRTEADAIDAAMNPTRAAPSRGAYNASDLNRVGEALNYLYDFMHEYGYGVAPLPRLRTNWLTTQNFAVQDGTHYLSMIRGLRNAFFTLPTTPQVPSHINNLFARAGRERANDIERLLLDIERIILWMIDSFHYSNQHYSNEPIMIAGHRTARRMTWAEINQNFTWADLSSKTWNEIMYGLGG